MTARKLWGTQYPRIYDDMRRHESKAAVYRYVRNEEANWLCGALRSPHLAIYVDERDGRGFQLYENIDLADRTAPEPY